MRDALSIEIDGLCLHGTRHTGPNPSRRGIVFFNSGAQPRSGRGELYVQLADKLAEHGFACFRFDMPGLGDSDGELPARHVDLYQLIQDGGHAACAARLTQVLLDMHKLDDMVLAGICGGAMTSVFAVPMLPKRISGLVLLDLLFFSVRPRTAPGAQEQPRSSWRDKQTRRLAQWKASIHDKILTSRWEPQITALYHKLKRASKAILPQRLPADANVKLLDVLTSVLNARIPALLISARPTQHTTPAFDYWAHLRQRCPRGWELVQIPGTTHSFVENGGSRAVLETILKWLSGHGSPHRGALPAVLDTVGSKHTSFSPEYVSAGSE